MKITVNAWCNVKTEGDTTNPRLRAEVTIPSLKANLHPSEARSLAAALIEAAEVAEKESK